MDTNSISIDLHLDVNGTIIAFDFAGGRNVLEEEILQNFLAKKIKAIWEENSEELTYMKYIENKYPLRDDFRKNQKRELSQIFNRMEKINHSDLGKYKNIYDLALNKLHIMKKESQHVFPSVFRLLDVLQQKQIQTTLLLRTFGSEGPLAGAEITKKFPDIQFQIPVDLEKTPISVDKLKQFDHQIIKDDYKKWREGERKRAFSKAFPIYDAKNRISLFFDDNIKTSKDCETKNIVNPYDPITGISVPVQDLLKRSLIRVNTLKAIVNDEYFVEKLNKALAKKGIILEACPPPTLSK